MISLFRSSLPKVRLTGPRVHIRPPKSNDQAQWLALRRESRDFLRPYEPSWPRDALTSAGFRRRIKRIQTEWIAESGYGFLVFRNDDATLLGGVTLANVRRGVTQSSSVGYWTGLSHTRKGYMFEALQLCLDFGFRTLDLHRVEAACLTENLASRRLLEKSGFQEEGMARRYLCIAGEWQDHIIYALLESDARPLIAKKPE